MLLNVISVKVIIRLMRSIFLRSPNSEFCLFLFLQTTFCPKEMKLKLSTSHLQSIAPRMKHSTIFLNCLFFLLYFYFTFFTSRCLFLSVFGTLSLCFCVFLSAFLYVSIFYCGRQGKRSLDRISLDRNCHFSLDRKF